MQSNTCMNKHGLCSVVSAVCGVQGEQAGETERRLERRLGPAVNCNL